VALTVADVPRSYPVSERRLIAALADQDPDLGPELVHQLARLGVLPVDPATGDFDVAACEPIITAAKRARAAGIAWPGVPAALFGQGCPVPREALIAAYHALFESMTEDVPSGVPRRATASPALVHGPRELIDHVSAAQVNPLDAIHVEAIAESQSPQPAQNPLRARHSRRAIAVNVAPV
jgi:hypothetical protein